MRLDALPLVNHFTKPMRLHNLSSIHSFLNFSLTVTKSTNTLKFLNGTKTELWHWDHSFSTCAKCSEKLTFHTL